MLQGDGRSGERTGDNEHRIRYLFDVEICFGTVLIGALKRILPNCVELLQEAKLKS